MIEAGAHRGGKPPVRGGEESFPDRDARVRMGEDDRLGSAAVRQGVLHRSLIAGAPVLFPDSGRMAGRDVVTRQDDAVFVADLPAAHLAAVERAGVKGLVVGARPCARALNRAPRPAPEDPAEPGVDPTEPTAARGDPARGRGGAWLACLN